MVAPTWIKPGCVQFLENGKRFYTAWVNSGNCERGVRNSKLASGRWNRILHRLSMLAPFNRFHLLESQRDVLRSLPITDRRGCMRSVIPMPKADLILEIWGFGGRKWLLSQIFFRAFLELRLMS
jgi:hypothetical protein